MVATVLLVAITVVLAGVLYFMLAGLGTGATAPRPIAVEFVPMGNPGASTSGYTWANFSLITSQLLTTAEFGVVLSMPGGLLLEAGQGNCGVDPTSCHVSGGWLVFLSDSEGYVVNVWNVSGWANGTIELSSSMVLGFVSDSALHAVSDGDYLKVTSRADPTVVGESPPL